jgi:hypothetical protein
MNKVIKKLTLPKVEPRDLYPPKRGIDFLVKLRRAIEDHVNEMTDAHNTATQQVGPAIVAADTIAVSNAMHPITGAGTINTITPSPGFSGPIFLLAKGAFSLGATGNIAIAKGPFQAGEHISLAYNDLEGLWYPRS